MKPVTRLVLLLAIAAMGLSAVGLVVGLVGVSAAGAWPAVTPTASLTPTTTVEPPIFTATLSMMPDRPAVRVGETLTISVDIDVSEGCQYPIFELSLAQDAAETPIFTHINPPVDMITGPISLPSLWTFQATAPGIATFDAQTFGEKNCGDAWIWHYLYGKSSPVVVGEAIYEDWLPAISSQ